MARKKLSALTAPFQGRWRIAEMDLWDNEALDLVEPAFLEIRGQEGQMRFIAVTAWLDIRYDARAGGPIAEFSWEGVDEGDQRSGRGWVAPGTAGRLVGHLYFHMGDDSGFVCEPWCVLQQPASGRRLTEDSMWGFPWQARHASLAHAHRDFHRRLSV